MQKPAVLIPKINIGQIRLHIPEILSKISRKNVIYLAMSMILSNAKVMGSLTPFGTAFFASVCNAKNLIPSLGGVAVGSIIAHPSAVSLCYVITAAAVALINILRDKPLNIWIKAVFTGLLLFFARTAMSAKGGLLIYDMLINFLEGFMCAMGVAAADTAVPVLFSSKRRKCLSCGESVSVVAIFALMASSFNNIPFFFDIKIGNILSIALILILNLYATVPTGAVVGIVAGAVASMGTYNAGNIIGAYAFSALVSVLLKRYGKIGVCLGFIIANAAITVFLNGSTEVLINIYEILPATVILFALPQKATEFVVHIAGISTAPMPDGGASGNVYRNRLLKIAKSLEILSQKPFSQSAGDISKKELSSLVSRTAQRTCSNCSLRYCCWQKKGAETQKSILGMLTSASNHGRAHINDLDDSLKNRCIRAENLVSSFNDSFELYRTNIMWNKRLRDCKTLSCAQIGSISKIMDNLAKENRTNADKQTLEKIHTELDSQGFSPKNIAAFYKDDGNLIIELKFSEKSYKDDFKYSIAPCLSEAIGIKIRFNEVYREKNAVYLTYSMRERFSHATGAACMKKAGEGICGDSFATVNLTNGTYVAAISDGMGSGEAAAKESRRTVDLLKTFLQCGFEVMQAVRLINSALVMTGSEEIFSTVDLCSINMHTGIADFIKIGSASTYIKTGKNVEKICASSLPAGILEDIKPKRISRQLENDSLIIMVSDGIENACADDKWLERKLCEFDVVNPHVVADKVLELAMYYSGGKAKDDMTVIATRVWNEKNV